MKSNPYKSAVSFLLCIIAGLFLSACGGGGAGGTGTLATSLTDSSTDQYKAVYVTIARIDVHVGGDVSNEGAWKTVATPNKTYNLLELVNGVRENLGLATLESGHYTQMRLIIGTTRDSGLNIFSRPHPYANYVIDTDDAIHELKVPSGTQTGLKIVNGFDINTNQTTELILDFDAMRSVVIAGSSGQYLLKPTVKVLQVKDCALVSGKVSAVPPVTIPPTAAVALPGTLLTAQVVSAPAPVDAKDQVAIDAGTVADENGIYSLFLMPGTYNLVAAREGYLPACTAVSLAAGAKPTINFGLASATLPLGTISGTITITGADLEQYATIDFRQTIDCGIGLTTVSVNTVNIANGGSYAFDVPAGSYQVVASTYGETTQVSTVSVAAGSTITQHIVFP